MPVGGDSPHQAGSTRCRRGASAPAPPTTMPLSPMPMGAGRRLHLPCADPMPALIGGSGIAGLPRADQERLGRHALPALVSGDDHPTCLCGSPGESGASGRARIRLFASAQFDGLRWPHSPDRRPGAACGEGAMAPLDRSRRNPLTAALVSGTLLASAGPSHEEREPARREGGSESRLRGSERGSLDSSCPTPQHVTASSIIASRATSWGVRER